MLPPDGRKYMPNKWRSAVFLIDVFLKYSIQLTAPLYIYCLLSWWLLSRITFTQIPRSPVEDVIRSETCWCILHSGTISFENLILRYTFENTILFTSFESEMMFYTISLFMLFKCKHYLHVIKWRCYRCSWHTPSRSCLLRLSTVFSLLL